MASRSLGTLTYDLIAKIGGFTAGMDAAERAAKKSSDAINKQIQAIGIAGYAAGEALGQYLKQGLDTLINLFPELIEQAAQFADIADKTGGSAQGFANFAVSAKVAGVEVDTIADATVKLSKSLVDVNSKSSPAAAGLKALGINIQEFLKLRPDQQIDKVADAFSQFADGGEKAAVAQQLFGRSGAELLKFFKDYTDNGGGVNILTGEMIQKDDDFGDALARLRAQISLTATALATEFIDPYNALIEVIKQGIAETYNLDTAAGRLGVQSGVKQFAEDTGRALAGAIDYVKQSVREFQVLVDFVTQSAQAVRQVADLDFKGASETGAAFRKKYGLDEFGRKVGDAGAEAGKTYVQRFNEELSRVNADRNRALLNKANYGTGGDDRPVLHPRSTQSGGGGGSDPAKKALDSHLKDLDRAISDEKELMAERNKILDLYNAQGLVSIQDYYAQQQNIRDEALAAQNKSYDAEVASLQSYLAKASPKDRASAQEKLNDTLDKQAKLNRDAGAAAVEAGIKQQQSTKAYQDQLDELNAKLLELNGNLAQAASIRFDLQNEKLRLRLQAEGNDSALKQLDALKQYTVAQAQLNQLQSKFSLAQGDAQLAEEKINRDRQNGSLGEIESLVKLGDARKQQLAAYQAEYAKYQELVGSGASLTDEQAQQLKRLRSQIDEVSSSIDPLAEKFNTMFADAFSNSFTEFLNGTKSLKDAFKDMINSFISELVRLAAQDVFKSLLGGGGSATGGVGFDFGSLLSGLFGGGRASGGPVAANTLYRVNERGPEVFEAANGDQFLMTGTGGGRVHPNGRSGAVTNISVTVPHMVDNRTRSQIAQDIAVQQRNARRFD